MNYFISDLHLGHKNVLKFDNRPFINIEEHDKTIIDNWNNKVNDNDDVYVLGDISWHNATKTIEIFKQLKGRIHLIQGNHDNRILKNKELYNLFVEVVDYKELKIDNEIKNKYSKTLENVKYTYLLREDDTVDVNMLVELKDKSQYKYYVTVSCKDNTLETDVNILEGNKELKLNI